MPDGRINLTLGDVKMSTEVTPQSYLVVAEEFQSAAVLIADHADELLPVFKYLVGQSLECALKGYVMAQGGNVRRKPHHDLEHWWQEAGTQGFDTAEGDIPAWVTSVNSAYDYPYLARYRQTNTGFTSPPIQEVVTELAGTIRAVKESL